MPRATSKPRRSKPARKMSNRSRTAENDDIPIDAAGARFITERTDLHAVSKWLAGNGWTVVTSELGYAAKTYPELSDDDRTQVGEFLQTLEDHDDVHRVWAAVK